MPFKNFIFRAGDLSLLLNYVQEFHLSGLLMWHGVQPGEPARGGAGADPHPVPGPRAAAAHHRLRDQVRQELAGREPRLCQVRGRLPAAPLGPQLLLQVRVY
jgi:hypothetical protein